MVSPKVVGLLHPLWKVLFPKYVCTLEDVGIAMIQATAEGYPKQILENTDITQLARASRGVTI